MVILLRFTKNRAKVANFSEYGNPHSAYTLMKETNAPQQRQSARLMRLRNSFLVRSELRKAPENAEVTVTAFAF